MNLQIHYDFFPNADISQAKKIYHRLAKENHPDHFPEEYRQIQELRMIEINEAYQNFLELYKLSKQISEPTADDFRNQNENTKADNNRCDRYSGKQNNDVSQCREIGEHHDPAYVYYKQGFIYFSKGINGILARRSPGQIKVDPKSVFEWANKSIRHFHKAHSYFSRVAAEYSESIWHTDAEEKLKRIKKFNMLYMKILNNIESRLECIHINN